MPIPLLTRRSVLALSTEGTLGTIETLDGDDVLIRTYNAKLRLPSTTIRRPRQGGLGSSGGVAGRKSSLLTFDTYLHGKGSAGVPNAGIIWTACGMSLSSQTYTNTSDTSTWKTLSAGHFIDGKRRVGRGMMGNSVFNFIPGEPVVVNHTFMGGWSADPTAVSLVTGTYEATGKNPPIWAGTAFLTVDGLTTILPSSVTYDMGNQVAERPDANTPGGVLSGWIGDRLGTISMDPEAVPIGTKNWNAIHSANTEIAITIVVGSAANNIATLQWDNLQLAEDPDEGDRDGKVTDLLQFHVNEDDFSIAYS